MEVDLLLDRAW